MNEDLSLTATELVAAASKTLEERGFRRVDQAIVDPLFTSGARVFEDVFAVVAVVVYETWEALSSDWMEAQASLVDLNQRLRGV